MLRKIGRLFVIKTRFEAYLIIYALALGAMTRGAHYTLDINARTHRSTSSFCRGRGRSAPHGQG